MHQIENSGIITVQAAKTANLIPNETAHMLAVEIQPSMQ